MYSYTVATCTYVYARNNFDAAIFKANWFRKTLRWSTSLIIYQGNNCNDDTRNQSYSVEAGKHIMNA